MFEIPCVCAGSRVLGCPILVVSKLRSGLRRLVLRYITMASLKINHVLVNFNCLRTFIHLKSMWFAVLEHLQVLYISFYVYRILGINLRYWFLQINKSVEKANKCTYHGRL